MKLDILIVEDSISFALELEMLLDELGYQTLAKVGNSADALEVIFSKEPDLILMDINIHGALNGIELSQKIKHLNIPILFITSLADEESYQSAQSANLIGYLVKPVQKRTLQTAIKLAIENVYASAYSTGQPTEALTDFLLEDRFYFKKGDTYHKVKVRDIAFIKSDRNYCETTTVQGITFISRITLSNFETMLPTSLFVRTHRQYIVQIDQIDALDFNNDVLLVKGQEIPLSRSNRKKVEAFVRKLE